MTSSDTKTLQAENLIKGDEIETDNGWALITEILPSGPYLHIFHTRGSDIAEPDRFYRVHMKTVEARQ